MGGDRLAPERVDGAEEPHREGTGGAQSGPARDVGHAYQLDGRTDGVSSECLADDRMGDLLHRRAVPDLGQQFILRDSLARAVHQHQQCRGVRIRST